MAEQEDDDTEKPHEATQHKLDEARKKGELARSADLNTAGSYAGLVLALLAAGAAMVETTSANLMALLERSHVFAELVFQGGQASAALGGPLWQVTLALALVFLLPAAGALLAAIAQHSFVLAPSKLAPKLSRINPIETAKNKFGSSGLFEFAKSLAKLVLYSVLLGVFVAYNLSDLSGTLQAEPAVIGAVMARMILQFLIITLLITLAVGAVDFFWQRHDHLRRQRMSHKELRDEVRQSEGDPALKQRRRQRGMEIASTQMMAEVPGADVVIVNPTHYAVALKWSRAPGSAPVCVAKGVDHVALTIREQARQNDVPIRDDPPAARALYATTELGEQIDPDHYAAVAVAIRFADDMRKKAGRFG